MSPTRVFSFSKAFCVYCSFSSSSASSVLISLISLILSMTYLIKCVGSKICSESSMILSDLSAIKLLSRSKYCLAECLAIRLKLWARIFNKNFKAPVSPMSWCELSAEKVLWKSILIFSTGQKRSPASKKSLVSLILDSSSGFCQLMNSSNSLASCKTHPVQRARVFSTIIFSSIE